MTAFLVVCGVGFFVALQCLVLGVILGAWIHASIYRDFKNRAEEDFRRRLGLEIGRLRMRSARLEQAKARAEAVYGRDLPESHKKAMDEEIENVLGSIWTQKDGE